MDYDYTLLSCEFAKFLNSRNIDETLTLREIILEGHYVTELKPLLFEFIGKNYAQFDIFKNLYQTKFIEYALSRLLANTL